MLTLLTNGLESEVEKEKEIKKQELKEAIKLEERYKRLKKKLKEEEENLFKIFKKHRTMATREQNLEWLQKKAERVGKDPEKLLKEFEDRLKAQQTAKKKKNRD